MDGMMQQPNQWIQGEPESQSAIMLAQHTTYFLKYKITITNDGQQKMENDEILDFIEPYNPDYPLAYLKGGQKALAAMSKCQNLAYAMASKILTTLKDEYITEIKNAKGNKKYDLIAKYISQDAAANIKFCVDYFNDFSRRKQSLIANSRTTGINPQQMREFKNHVESANGNEPQEQKKGILNFWR
jgi:hypothetical protein